MSRVRATVDRLWALARGRSLRQVLTLVTGATGATALVFAARPVLTRLYTPEAFGLLGVFVAPVYLLATLATLRYDDAIAVPHEPRDGAGVFVLAALGSVGLGLLLTLALPFRQSIAVALGAPELAPLLWLAPPVTVCLGLAAAARTWLSRVERYRVMSLAVLAQAVAVVAVQLVLFDSAEWGLVLGTTLGAAALALVSVGAAARAGAFADARSADLRALARRFRRFPLYGIPASGLGQLAVRLPPLVLVGAFGPSVVGYFTVAVSSVALPVGLVTDAVGHVFYVRAAEASRAERLGPLVERVFARLAAFAALPVLAAALFGPDLFAVVFGETWREAGVFARILSPWLLLATIAPPLTRVFDVTERQRAELGVGATIGVVIGTALWIGVSTGAVVPALMVLSVGGVLARLIQLGWIAHVGHASAGRMAWALTRSVAAAALALSPAAAVLAWGGFWPALATAVIGAAGYALWALPPADA